MTSLRTLLKSSNTDYYSRFNHVHSEVTSVMSNSRIFFPTYTNHDFKHLTNVEEIINKMLTEEVKKELSDEEIFCLLSAAWLHDIGMIPVNDEKEEYENMSPDERKEYSTTVRDHHNIRSKNYVESNKEKLNIDDFEADIIGNICKGHREVELGEYKDTYSKTKIRLSSLSAILRLADECDVSHNRESLLSEEGADEEIKEEHYRIHKLVRTPVFDHENQTIKLVSIAYTNKDKKLLEEKRDKIQGELDEILPCLKKIGVDFKKVELDCRMDKEYVKKRIILSIINDNDPYSNDDEWISDDDINNSLEELICDKKVLKDEKFKLTEDIKLFKEIYRMFLNEWMGKFFFTEYVENIITKSIWNIENKFKVKFNEEERVLRSSLLKNSPTALYMLLFVDEIINYPSFNISSHQDGKLLFDSIISLGIFNDIHRYTHYIKFKNLANNIKKLKFYDIGEIEEKINFYKVYREY